MEYIENLINSLESAIKELDELMFCLTSQKQINRAIMMRDEKEEELGRITHEALNQLSSIEEFLLV